MIFGKFFNHARNWLLVLALFLAPMMHASDSTAPRLACRRAASALVAPWQDGNFEDSYGPHFFRLFIPGAGILMAEVSSLGHSETPSLELLDASCQPLADSFSAHHAHRLRIFETPGFYYVRITPRSSAESFAVDSTYRLQSSFFPHGTTKATCNTPQADKDGELEEERDEWDEVTCDTSPANGDGEGGEVEEKRDEWDELSVPYGALCPQLPGDDHGETLTCASAITLGTSLVGRLENGIIEDRDTLLFSLEKRSVVAFQVESEVPLEAELLDLAGRQTEMTSMPVGSGWLLVATLPAGDHALRLSALGGAEGSWRLHSAGFPLEWQAILEELEP